jgi:hypothetical protein
MGQIEEADMPKARKGKRQEHGEPHIPLPSFDLIRHVMEAGQVDAKQRKVVEDGLGVIREKYLRDWLYLDYYATDKQLGAHLNDIKTRAASLRKALHKSKAAQFALRETLILTSSDPDISDRDKSDMICADHERDIAGVSRLHDLAAGAQQRHDLYMEEWPNRSAKQSAEKPETQSLVLNIYNLWATLGRSETGRDASNFANFAARILEYVLDRPEIKPDTVDDLLRKARAARAKSIRFVTQGGNEH